MIDSKHRSKLRLCDRSEEGTGRSTIVLNKAYMTLRKTISIISTLYSTRDVEREGWITIIGLRCLRTMQNGDTLRLLYICSCGTQWQTWPIHNQFIAEGRDTNAIQSARATHGSLIVRWISTQHLPGCYVDNTEGQYPTQRVVDENDFTLNFTGDWIAKRTSIEGPIPKISLPSVLGFDIQRTTELYFKICAAHRYGDKRKFNYIAPHMS